MGGKHQNYAWKFSLKSVLMLHLVHLVKKKISVLGNSVMISVKVLAKYYLGAILQFSLNIHTEQISSVI